MRGERQKTHHDVALLQHRLEIGKARDARDFLGPPAPADDVEAERGELRGDVAAELAQPEQADRPIGGEVLIEPVPALRLLLS